MIILYIYLHHCFLQWIRFHFIDVLWFTQSIPSCWNFGGCLYSFFSNPLMKHILHMALYTCLIIFLGKFLGKELLGQKLCMSKSFGAHGPIWSVEIWIHWNSHQQDENVVCWPLCQHWGWEMEGLKLFAWGRPVPQTGSEKKFRQDIALDTWAQGLQVWAVGLHPSRGPREFLGSRQETGMGSEGTGVAQGPGGRENLLLSDPAMERKQNQVTCLGWGLNLRDMPQRADFRARQGEREEQHWGSAWSWLIRDGHPIRGHANQGWPWAGLYIYSGHPLSPQKMPSACSRKSRVVPRTRGRVGDVTGRADLFLSWLRLHLTTVLSLTSRHRGPGRFNQHMPRPVCQC